MEFGGLGWQTYYLYLKIISKNLICKIRKIWQKSCNKNIDLQTTKDFCTKLHDKIANFRQKHYFSSACLVLFYADGNVAYRANQFMALFHEIQLSLEKIVAKLLKKMF